MPIPKAVAQLCIPTVLSSLVMILYNLADTYFVGILNDPIQNAAVTLAYPVMLAFNAINNLFGVGTSSMMSRSLGTGDHERVKSCAAFGFYGALFSGLLFSVVCTIWKAPLLRLLGADTSTWQATAQYMLWTVSFGAMPAILNVVQGLMVRSEGYSMHAGIGTMSGCLLNIILDPLFILPWGLNMGAAGAGLATFLSNCAACIYFLTLARIQRGKTLVSMDIRRLRHLPKGIISGVFGVGVPASVQNLLNVVGPTILNSSAAAYGASAVAAMGVANKVVTIPLQASMGFAQGTMPMVSYNFASGNRTRMKQTVLFALRLLLPVMLLFAAGYWLWAGPLIGAFIDNTEIVAYGTRFLRAMCLSIPFMCVDYVGVCVFQATGMGKAALAFSVVRKLVLEIPLLLLLNRLYPLYGMPYAQVIAEAVLAIVAVFMLLRIFREKAEASKGLPEQP